uniref:Candidate secreted effector n=1 Tax=Meloidogyne incognita TaxID=6306 RepID=A0A914M9P8_MELIC
MRMEDIGICLCNIFDRIEQFSSGVWEHTGTMQVFFSFFCCSGEMLGFCCWRVWGSNPPVGKFL